MFREGLRHGHGVLKEYPPKTSDDDEDSTKVQPTRIYCGEWRGDKRCGFGVQVDLTAGLLPVFFLCVHAYRVNVYV